MSHIVCDICGTSYDPTLDQCPLCGKKRDELDLLVQEPEGRPEEPREPRMVTKGGRFSPKNVERTNREREAAAAVGAQNLFRKSTEDRPKPPKEEPYPDEPQEPRRGGKIAVWILSALAILLAVFIVTRFLLGRSGSSKPRETTPATTADTTETKPCTSINLGTSGIKLKQVGETYLLTVKVQPEGTTDKLTFTSGDERVAKVSGDGVVTCVGSGETKITVTCGKVSVVCKVTCAVQETETTEATTKETTKPTEKETEPKDNNTTTGTHMNIEDMTLFHKGEIAYLEVLNAKGQVINGTATWSVDDSSVATVSGNGTVTAVGYGTTRVYATVDGKSYSCIVRCYFTTHTEPEETTESTTEATEPEETTETVDDGGIRSDGDPQG